MIGYLMPLALGALLSAAYHSRRRTPSPPGHDRTAPHPGPNTAAPHNTPDPTIRRPSEREVLLQTFLEHNEQLLNECHDRLQQQSDVLDELEQRQERYQLLVVAFLKQRDADQTKIEALEQEVRALNAELQRLRHSLPGGGK